LDELAVATGHSVTHAAGPTAMEPSDGAALDTVPSNTLGGVLLRYTKERNRNGGRNQAEVQWRNAGEL
jgi:hypothetical protein